MARTKQTAIDADAAPDSIETSCRPPLYPCTGSADPNEALDVFDLFAIEKASGVSSGALDVFAFIEKAALIE